MRMLLHWLANALALFALPYIFTTITVDSFVTALIVALVLALINTLIRPLLVLLTLPVTIVTLGLFIFVINALMLMLTGRIARAFDLAFRVDGFGAALLGALVIAVVSFILGRVLASEM